MRKTQVLVLLLVYISLFTNFALAGPASTNFELKQYDFGSGGTENSASTNFNLFAISGETDTGSLSSTNFTSRNGLTFTQLANLPPAPAFTNPESYYNKLHLTINTGSNSSDTKFAIAISTDNFVSDTKYIQNDNTIGSSLGSEDWQTYTSWGGASGIDIIGLAPNITYTVKVSAQRGNFTHTGFGPTVQAATIAPTLTFDIDVSPTDSKTSPPFTISLSDLTVSTVITASNKIWVDIDTNGASGGHVYVYGTNNGLRSNHVDYTINSISTDLASAQEGYGAKSSSTTQTSGGPIQAVSPYNGALDNVGIIDTTKREIFNSSSQPVTSGRASFEIKAKSGALTQAASDYTDTLTVIVTAAF